MNNTPKRLFAPPLRWSTEPPEEGAWHWVTDGDPEHPPVIMKASKDACGGWTNDDDTAENFEDDVVAWCVITWCVITMPPKFRRIEP